MAVIKPFCALRPKESLTEAIDALPTGWHQEIAYFVDCVKNGIAPDKYQTFDQVLDSYCMLLAEEESVNCGKAVEVKYV